MKKRAYKKIAYVLSLCVVLLWAVLGTGTSLAWFTDTTHEIKNVFHTGEFKLKVSHRTESGWYEVMDGETRVFDDEALYEPGYTQVVYLKAENEGTVPFNMRTAVSVTDYTVATNVFGSRFDLQDYLTFGLVMADTEAELDEKSSHPRHGSGGRYHAAEQLCHRYGGHGWRRSKVYGPDRPHAGGSRE